MNQRGLAVLLLISTGCGDKSGGGGSAALKSALGIDLATARGLVVVPRSGVGQGGLAAGLEPIGGAPTNVLYAIDASGNLTKTSVTEANEAESETTTISPLAVFDTKRYVVLAYQGVKKDDRDCALVLARKADGSLYCLPGGVDTGFTGGASDLPRDAYVLSDGTGDVLYVNGPGFTRLDLTDPANPTSTEVIDAAVSGGRRAVDFAVNPDGDALVHFSFDKHLSRIVKAGGGFQNISTEQSGCSATGFAAGSNDFHMLESRTFVKLSKTGGTFERSETGKIPDSEPTTGFPCQTGLVKTSTALVLTLGRQLITVTDTSATSVTLPTLTSVTQIAGALGQVMLLGTDATGNGGILRYDVAEETFTTLLPPGEFAVSSMAVSATGETTFQGERASDGARILGNIAPGASTIEVVSQGLPKAVALIRLN